MGNSISDGGPAFPRPIGADSNQHGTPHWRIETVGGMTLRDYFAAQGVVALGAHRAVTARGIPWLVEHAYMIADAMLKQRAVPPPRSAEGTR